MRGDAAERRREERARAPVVGDEAVPVQPQRRRVREVEAPLEEARVVGVAAGALVSTLEDVDEEVSAGQMCGESAALTKARRASTVACAADGPAQVYVLGAIALAALPAELKLELALLSMRYMSHRLDHVANRIRKTRCLSI